MQIFSENLARKAVKLTKKYGLVTDLPDSLDTFNVNFSKTI